MDKESSYNAGDLSSIAGSGRSPGGGPPLQYFSLENPIDRGAWRAIVPGVPESHTGLKWQSTHAHTSGTYPCSGRGCWEAPLRASGKGVGERRGSSRPFSLTQVCSAVVRAFLECSSDTSSPMSKGSWPRFSCPRPLPSPQGRRRLARMFPWPVTSHRQQGREFEERDWKCYSQEDC